MTLKPPDGATIPVNDFVDVLREAPPNVQYPEFGARGNGSTDDSAAFAAAKVALGPNGGEIFVPPGAYNLGSTGANFNDTRNITLRGAGGKSAGASPATILRFTGASGSAITARSSYGFALKDCMVVYNNASFAGTLIDLSQSTNDTAYAVVERCYIGGSGVRGAGRLVDLDKAIIAAFRDCIFTDAANAVRGQAAAGSYSNVMTFDNCTFQRSTSQHTRNAGEAWTFRGCTFEALCTAGGAAAGAGAHTFDASVVSEALTYVGCWFGDATTAGDWINFNGQGLVALGNHIGGGNVGIRTDQNNTIGVSLIGNTFDGQNSAGIVVSGTGHKGFVIEGNVMIAGAAPVLSIGGTFPAGSRIQDPAQAGAFVYTSEAKVFTATVNDSVFPATPVDGMFALEDVAGTRKACYRIGGTWYKATLT